MKCRKPATIRLLSERSGSADEASFLGSRIIIVLIAWRNGFRDSKEWLDPACGDVRSKRRAICRAEDSRIGCSVKSRADQIGLILEGRIPRIRRPKADFVPPVIGKGREIIAIGEHERQVDFTLFIYLARPARLLSSGTSPGESSPVLWNIAGGYSPVLQSICARDACWSHRGKRQQT